MSDMPHSGNTLSLEELTTIVKELTRAVNTQAALLQTMVQTSGLIVKAYDRLTNPPPVEEKKDETPKEKAQGLA